MDKKSLLPPLFLGLVTLPLLAGGQQTPSSPLTPQIKQNLRSEVITLIAEAFVKPGSENTVVSEGFAYVTQCRKEPGCVQYQFQQDAADPTHFFFYEQYSNAAAFEAHGSSEHVKTFFGQVLGPVAVKPIAIYFLNKIDNLRR
jgi:(4S)-4-hydroxy-5-phosphonooxypentane-2,3-dione isomerase